MFRTKALNDEMQEVEIWQPSAFSRQYFLPGEFRIPKRGEFYLTYNWNPITLEKVKIADFALTQMVKCYGKAKRKYIILKEVGVVQLPPKIVDL